MKSKGRSIDMVMLETTGSREEATWGEEEMNQGTLLYSKWELGFEDSESQWAVGKLFGLV